MNRPYIPQRVVEGTCVLDGPKFTRKICRRCGYRRNASKVMPRYAMCDDPQTVEEKRREMPAESAPNAFSTVANRTGTE